MPDIITQNDNKTFRKLVISTILKIYSIIDEVKNIVKQSEISITSSYDTKLEQKGKIYSYNF